MDVVVHLLCTALEARDAVTHVHAQRTSIYATGLGRVLGLDPIQLETLRIGALLHDIGKIGVPDAILNKPSRLTPEEFDRMKAHTIIGDDMLRMIDFAPYSGVRAVVRGHHERFDGKGYPDGLRGDEIPYTARILSVVDAFDGCKEPRPYHSGRTREEAIEIIREGRYTRFDPRIVDTFLTFFKKFESQLEEHLSHFPTRSFQFAKSAEGARPHAGSLDATAPPSTCQCHPENLSTKTIPFSAGDSSRPADLPRPT